MLQTVSIIIGQFRRNPLPAICGLLVGAVIFLWLQLNSEREAIDKKGQQYEEKVVKCAEEKVAMQRDFNVKTDSILRVELRKTEQQNKEMQEVINLLKKSRK